MSIDSPIWSGKRLGPRDWFIAATALGPESRRRGRHEGRSNAGASSLSLPSGPSVRTARANDCKRGHDAIRGRIVRRPLRQQTERRQPLSKAICLNNSSKTSSTARWLPPYWVSSSPYISTFA